MSSIVQYNTGGWNRSSSSGPLTSSNGTPHFSSDTTEGSLLLCVCGAVCNDDSVPAIAAPTGGSWVLIGGGTFPGNLGGNIAVYAISNAPSIPSSTTIEFTATFAEDSNAVANWLFEIGSLTGTLDTYETGTGEYIGSESTVPSTPNLDTSATDFIFVVSWGQESSCPAGSGYTSLSFPSGLFGLNAQYILSQPSGSVPTSFGNPSHGIDYFYWNCVACAFNVLPPSLNFVQNGPPLQIPYELVAYQGATLTGSYAYSCGPPIIRGLYQTPISTHT